MQLNGSKPNGYLALKKLQFLKEEKLYIRKKYTEVTNNWNYGASSRLTSLPSVDLKNLGASFPVTQCVQNQKAFKTNCKV